MRSTDQRQIQKQDWMSPQHLSIGKMMIKPMMARTMIAFVLLMAPTLKSESHVLSQQTDEPSLMTFPLIPFEELARRRRMSLEEAALFRGLGTHYLDLYCGTPTPKLRTVTIDTGSGYIAFPCTGCQQCGTHLDATYDPTQSSTFKKISCSNCQSGTCSSSSSECIFSAQYIEGDGWEAYEASDTCYAGDSKTASTLEFGLYFGCQTKVTGFFVSQLEDGIMGMGNFNTSFWNQMYLNGKIKNAAFSVCYSPSDNLGTSSQGAASGVLVLGGTDTRLHTSTMIYSSGATSATYPFFFVGLRNIHLQASGSSNIVTLSLTSSQLAPTKGVIVDSGTTFSDLYYAWADAFDQAWFNMVGTVYNQTYVTSGQLSSLPTLLFQFQGDSTANAQIKSSSSSSSVVFMASSVDSQHPHDVIVALQPKQYMQFDNNAQLYGPIITFRQTDTAILGGNFIMERDVFFDVENDRIGWATSQCSYSQVSGSGGSPTPPISPSKPIINRTPTMAPGGSHTGGGGFFGFFSAAPPLRTTFASKYVMLLGMGMMLVALSM